MRRPGAGIGISVRAASPDDAALVHRLTLDAWTGTVAADSTLYDETTETVERVLAEGGALILEVGGVPAGCVRYLPVAGDERCWEVKRLGVSRARRGRGLGLLLMEAVESLARERGVRRIQLGVRRDQPRLLAFYAAQGYRDDPSVRLGSSNPRTDPPYTLSKEIA